MARKTARRIIGAVGAALWLGYLGYRFTTQGASALQALRDVLIVLVPMAISLAAYWAHQSLDLSERAADLVVYVAVAAGVAAFLTVLAAPF